MVYRFFRGHLVNIAICSQGPYSPSMMSETSRSAMVALCSLGSLPQVDKSSSLSAKIVAAS